MEIDMEEWKEYKLGELTNLITKGTTPSMIGANFVNHGINFIKSESIIMNSRVLDTSKYMFISDETHKRLKRSQIQNNDILFSMAGMFLGKTGIVTKNDIPANTNQAVAIIRIDSDKADFMYIYYYLNQKKVIEYVNRASGQSAQPNINLREIGELKIKLPKLNIQKKISFILSCIDDKIELNNKINENLEQQAQAIFKSWFVDFEPFGGKMPEDWKEGTIKDLSSSIICGKTPSTKLKENYGHDVPFITIPDMHNQVYIVNTERKLSNKGAAIQLTKNLPKNTICVSCIGTAGLVSLVSEISQTNQQINSIIPKEKVSPYYVYLLMQRSADKINKFGQSGSTIVNLNKTQFEKLEAIVPSELIMKKFNVMLEPIFEQILLNQKECNTLANLRDSLLPKLMSGEIDVSKVDI